MHQLDEMLKHATLTIEDEFEMQKIRQIAIESDAATTAALIMQMYKLMIQHRRMLTYMIKKSLTTEQPINGNRL